MRLAIKNFLRASFYRHASLDTKVNKVIILSHVDHVIFSQVFRLQGQLSIKNLQQCCCCFPCNFSVRNYKRNEFSMMISVAFRIQ